MTPTGAARHLVTGATGFVGGLLVLELLARSEDDIVCLVRARAGATAEERLRTAIAAAANAYGHRDLLNEAAARVHTVEGDLAALTTHPSAVGRVDTVWHVAASLNFLDRQRDETLRRNTQATVELADLAVAAGAREFVFFSTAYVAGAATGRIFERPLGAEAPPNNPYEESKRHAEAHLLGRDDIRVRILRPSIVIGHSRNHAALSDAGLYAMIKGLVDFKRRLADVVERTLGRRMLAIGDGSAPLNLIPVDAVVRNALAIHRSDSPARIFHLVNSRPPTVDEVTDVFAETIGYPRPRYVTSRDGMTDLEHRLADIPRNSLFAPYLAVRRDFDLTNTDGVVGREASRFDLGPAGLRPYIDWYLRNVLGEPVAA
jgi:nucleoside-diphosphate-sugar epimerase